MFQLYLKPAFKAIITGGEYDAPTIDAMIETAIVTALSTSMLKGPGTPDGSLRRYPCNTHFFAIPPAMSPPGTGRNNNVADMIRDTVQAYKNKKPDSPEGRIVQRMDHLREQLQNAFAIGLSEGGYNYQHGGEANTVQESDVKKDIAVLQDGKLYVKASRNVITGKTLAERRKNITDFFNNLLGGKQSLDIPTLEGDVLTITKKQTAEKARDNYKIVDGNPVRMSDEEFAVKLRVEAHIDEVAEIARGKQSKGDEKNHSFAKDGFVYRKAYFEDFDGQYYEITISIGQNGTVATIYNVGKIDESVLPSAKLIAVVGSKPLSKTLSKKSIRHTTEKVNKKSVRYQMNAAAQEHLQAATGDMGADVDALKQLVSMLNKQTGMSRLKHGTLDAAASFLMRTAGARGDKQQLMRMLHEFYSYVGQNDNLSWEAIQQEARPIAEWLTDNMVRSKQMSEYAAEVLDTVRHSRIYLDDAQRKEVEYAFGSYGAYRSAMMGSMVLANDHSISLDMQWQEWAGMYPDVFDEDMNATDMPGELMNIIQRMRNSDTCELEFEYNRDFIIQDLTNRVYDSYWNAATLYVVADQYEQKIRQLKGKHKQHMAEVYQRHRAAEESLRKEYKRRTEELEAQYEERYQRREYEYRDSRRRAVERHDKAQVRQQIRKDVERLASLLNKGNKQKMTASAPSAKRPA